MRKIILLPVLLGFLPWGSVLSAAQTNEEQLIKILQSTSSSPRDKSGACAQLKLVGTKHSVDALAALLTDEELSHSARYVLETLPAPKAGKALRQALNRTSGPLQVGIIDSLAVRRESAAVSDLAKLLSSHDDTVAIAAAEALGHIGGSSALKRLQASAATSQGHLHQAETDAILMGARSLLDSGKLAAALKIFGELYKTDKAGPISQAAFGGMILASGNRGFALAADAIANGDTASRAAALHLAAQLPGTEATMAFASLALGAKAPIQIALIECLVQRGDPAALPAVTQLADSMDASVRLAAITALGGLGTEASVKLLAEKAANGKGADRNAARQSLLELYRGPVTHRMLGLLDPASPEIESELIRAMGGRGDQSATPALLNLAGHGNDNERAASLQALGQLADASRIPDVVQLVAGAGSDDLRSKAADALSAMYQRTQSAAVKPDVDALVKAVATGSIETRLALLPVCSELSRKSVRTALRTAVADSDARIREAGIHALCETHDPQLLPDLLALSDGRGGDAVRHLAIRGCVRLTSPEEDPKFSTDKKFEVFTKILGDPLDAGDKRLVLSGLAGVADPRALTPALGLLDDIPVRAEAEQAIIHIAGLIQAKNQAEARAALQKVLDVSTDATARNSAKAILSKMK